MFVFRGGENEDLIWINYWFVYYIDIFIGVLNIFEIWLGKFGVLGYNNVRVNFMEEKFMKNKVVIIKDVVCFVECLIVIVL